MYIYLYIHIYVYIYIYMCIYIYLYTYMFVMSLWLCGRAVVIWGDTCKLIHLRYLYKDI